VVGTWAFEEAEKPQRLESSSLECKRDYSPECAPRFLCLNTSLIFGFLEKFFFVLFKISCFPFVHVSSLQPNLAMLFEQKLDPSTTVMSKKRGSSEITEDPTGPLEASPEKKLKMEEPEVVAILFVLFALCVLL
jgi:hypothetical protein